MQQLMDRLGRQLLQLKYQCEKSIKKVVSSQCRYKTMIYYQVQMGRLQNHPTNPSLMSFQQGWKLLLKVGVSAISPKDHQHFVYLDLWTKYRVRTSYLGLEDLQLTEGPATYLYHFALSGWFLKCQHETTNKVYPELVKECCDIKIAHLDYKL